MVFKSLSKELIKNSMNQKESPEIDPYICGNLGYDRMAVPTSGELMSHPINSIRAVDFS